MLSVVALLVVSSRDPAQTLYLSFQKRLAGCHSAVIVTGDSKYSFMGKRYRLESPNITIVCDGMKVYRKEGNEVGKISPAPKSWPDDIWLRGFEKMTKGSYPPTCRGLQSEMFGGKKALSVDTHYSESPLFNSNLFFDAKTKLPVGFRAYERGELTQEVFYKKVVLNPPLKASDFNLPKD